MSIASCTSSLFASDTGKDVVLKNKRFNDSRPLYLETLYRFISLASFYGLHARRVIVVTLVGLVQTACDSSHREGGKSVTQRVYYSNVVRTEGDLPLGSTIPTTE